MRAKVEARRTVSKCCPGDGGLGLDGGGSIRDGKCDGILGTFKAETTGFPGRLDVGYKRKSTISDGSKPRSGHSEARFVWNRFRLWHVHILLITSEAVCLKVGSLCVTVLGSGEKHTKILPSSPSLHLSVLLPHGFLQGQ